MVDRLLSAEPTLVTSSLGTPIAEATGLQQTDAESVAAFLISLHVQRERREDVEQASISEFVDAAVAGLAQLNEREPAAGLDGLKAALERFLSTDSGSRVSAKAADILYDQERLFQGARILTDVRPVFADPVDSGVRVAMLLHTLRLEYFDAGSRGVKSFYVAVDRQDLQAIRRLVDRALDKEHVLAETLKAAEISVLIPPDGQGGSS